MKYQVGRVAAAPNHQADSSGGTDRMETELIGWLTGLEPTGAPIALRLRTFADLREEAARPRPRLPWLMPAVSSIGSLGAVVIGASLIMLIAVVGATVDHVHAVAGAMAPLAGSGTFKVAAVAPDRVKGVVPVLVAQ